MVRVPALSRVGAGLPDKRNVIRTEKASFLLATGQISSPLHQKGKSIMIDLNRAVIVLNRAVMVKDAQEVLFLHAYSREDNTLCHIQTIS